MPNLSLIKQERFGADTCDLYRGENDEIFMTREQVGRALEYSDPAASIANIHARNKDRLEPLSGVIKLISPTGGMQDTTVYTARGVMEICRLSRQPKADAFMDWVWDVIEQIRKGQHVAPEKPLTALQRAQLELKRDDQNIRKAQILASMCLPQMDKDVIMMLAMNVADFLQGRAPRLPDGDELRMQTYPIKDAAQPTYKPKTLHIFPGSHLFYEQVAQYCGVPTTKVKEIASKFHMIEPMSQGNRYTYWACPPVTPGERRRKRVAFTEEGVQLIMDMLSSDI